MIILDTNVISEAMKNTPNTQVLAWIAEQPTASLFTTTLSQAEILYGIELLTNGRRRADLLAAAHPVFDVDFAGRVLPFDSDAAVAFSYIAAERKNAGHPISHIDAMIAAVARSRGARLATRNVPDFTDCGIAVINPWEEA